MAGDAERTTRRFVLSVAAGSALTGGLLYANRDGPLGLDAERPTPEWAGAPVLDNAGAPSDTATVRVRVLSGGDPVGNELVLLRDRGGTYDERVGRTGPEGRIVFRESVGGRPCNDVELVVPARDRTADLGCLTGGTTVDRVFDVDLDGAGPQAGAWSEAPVVDHGGAPSDTVEVRLRLLEDGHPATETVVLHDHGDGDRRVTATGADGRIVFEERVDSASCNRLTVDLPERGRRVDLGCLAGPATVERTVELGD